MLSVMKLPKKSSIYPSSKNEFIISEHTLNSLSARHRVIQGLGRGVYLIWAPIGELNLGSPYLLGAADQYTKKVVIPHSKASVVRQSSPALLAFGKNSYVAFKLLSSTRIANQ